MEKVFLIEEIRYEKMNHGLGDESENIMREPYGYFVGTEEEAIKLCEQMKQRPDVKRVTYEMHGDDLEGATYPMYQPLELKQLSL